MIKRVLMACLAALALSAQASPIAWVNAQYGVDAVALTGDGADAQSTPLGAAPATASAAVVGQTDVATAGASSDVGLLFTSVDVSAAGLGSATGAAYFSGSFLNGGRVLLSLDFTQFDIAVGSGAAAASLFVTLMNDGVTLYDDFVTGSMLFDYASAEGTMSSLMLTLTSDANVGFQTAGEGNAVAFGLVTFDGTVPLPATGLLLLAGLGALVTIRRSAQRV